MSTLMRHRSPVPPVIDVSQLRPPRHKRHSSRLELARRRRGRSSAEEAPVSSGSDQSADDDVEDGGGEGGEGPQTVLVRRGEPTSLTVRISGHPRPEVMWYVGRKPVSEMTLEDQQRFTVDSDLKAGTYTLNVSADATDELEAGGVWVVAANEAGQDYTNIKVKTYRGLNDLQCLLPTKISNIAPIFDCISITTMSRM